MKTRGTLGLLALLAAGCGSLPRAYGEDVGLHTHFLGGYRALDHEAFDSCPVVGLELVTRDPAAGWGYELGGLYGSEEEQDGATTHEAEFDELYLGLRKSYGEDGGAMHPYFGLGGAWMRTENTLRSAAPTREFDDHGGGAYVHGGVLWSLGRYPFDRGTEILVGFDVRGVVGDDLDYAQGALVLGFGR